MQSNNWVVEVKNKNVSENTPAWSRVGSWPNRRVAREDAKSFRTEYGRQNVRIRKATEADQPSAAAS